MARKATKGKTSITQDEDKFPFAQLAMLGICRLAEPVAFISIVSYNFAMVREIKGPENASFWAGVLVSAFAIAEASTAMVWGSLSDRYGRKPIILTGLMGTTASCLVLGFAKNYWVALAARLLGGLLNGNVAVMQTMVAEIVKNPKHEPRAYSIQPFAWSLGSVLGSALGGYAAQPARFYPAYFSQDGLFGRYPYLLPNLIAAVCLIMAIVAAALFLEESNPAVREYTAVAESEPEMAKNDENTPLLSGRRISITEALTTRTRTMSYSSGTVPTTNDPVFDMRKPSFASGRTINQILEANSESSESAIEDDDEIEDETSTTVFTRPVIMWIVAIACLCYHQMAYVSVFPIYVLDKPHVDHGLDFHGGLGLTVHDTGRYMALNSVMSLLIQAFILPVFLGKLGIFRSIVIMSIIAPIVDVCMPFLSAASDPATTVYPFFMLFGFCNIIIYPSLLIMLKNATPSKQALGRINGLAVSASSAARTIAPPLIGLIYNALGSAGAWWSCALFGLFLCVELLFVPREGAAGEDEV